MLFRLGSEFDTRNYFSFEMKLLLTSFICVELEVSKITAINQNMKLRRSLMINPQINKTELRKSCCSSTPGHKRDKVQT